MIKVVSIGKSETKTTITLRKTMIDGKVMQISIFEYEKLKRQLIRRKPKNKTK